MFRCRKVFKYLFIIAVCFCDGVFDDSVMNNMVFGNQNLACFEYFCWHAFLSFGSICFLGLGLLALAPLACLLQGELGSWVLWNIFPRSKWHDAKTWYHSSEHRKVLLIDCVLKDWICFPKMLVVTCVWNFLFFGPGFTCHMPQESFVIRALPISHASSTTLRALWYWSWSQVSPNQDRVWRMQRPGPHQNPVFSWGRVGQELSFEIRRYHLRADLYSLYFWIWECSSLKLMSNCAVMSEDWRWVIALWPAGRTQAYATSLGVPGLQIIIIYGLGQLLKHCLFLSSRLVWMSLLVGSRDSGKMGERRLLWMTFRSTQL